MEHINTKCKQGEEKFTVKPGGDKYRKEIRILEGNMRSQENN